jgi:hypothetical protein
MKIIETTAPVKIEELKKYFADKDTFYLIDYANSDLKGTKLLTYLSNLDIPSDIKLEAHTELADGLLLDYLNSPFLVNIPFLEKEAIRLLLQYKGVNDFGYTEFIKANKELLDLWASILDSLLYFNTYSINDDNYKEQIKQAPRFDNNLTIGINFVSLLKYDDFYDFYTTVDSNNFKYHEVYFNDYIFKGKNLYHYWANPNNSVFIITWAIVVDKFDPDEFVEAMKRDIEEIQSVPSV